jgi:hypothetical protein
MPAHITTREKEKIVMLWKKHKNVQKVRAEFSKRHKPDRRTIKKVIAKRHMGKCSQKRDGSEGQKGPDS